MTGGPVTIVGGGIGGLAAALFLARRGRQVEVLEQDPHPPEEVGAAAVTPRRGTPQAGQSHAFVARCHALLAAEAPEVLDQLVAVGAGQLRLDANLPGDLLAPPPPDPDLIVLTARRPVFEWALRQVVEREPGVTVRHGVHVTGLTRADEGIVGRVTGVTLDDGTSVAGELVVNACGRRSAGAGWLADLNLPEGQRSPVASPTTRAFSACARGPNPGP